MAAQPQDDSALIRQAQHGSLNAFNALVLRHQDMVYSVSYRIMGDSASAADAAQEAFIAAFRRLSTYRGGSFRAWLLRIATNACYDELRRRKRRPVAPLEDGEQADPDERAAGAEVMADAQDGPERAAERAELARAIQGCLEGLPDDFRVVAVLADVQGYDYAEIAAVVGTPLGTVKSRLARARLRLRDCLQRYRELLPTAYRLQDESPG